MPYLETVNNPTDWPLSYNYVPSTNSIYMGSAFESVYAAIGVTDADLAGATGDVRASYHALFETMYTAYEERVNSSFPEYFLSKSLQIIRNRVVDPTNNIRHTTYTLRIREGGTATVDSFASTGVLAE